MTYSLIVFQATVLCQITNAASQFLPQMSFQGRPMQMGQNAMHPMGMPMPMQMQMPMQMNQNRMPVVVMPYHSKGVDQKHVDREKKHNHIHRRRKRKHHSRESSSSSSGSSSSSSSSIEYGNTGMRSNKKRRQVLTPVISYVTKDGYVVYQKKVKKDKARDWLELGKQTPSRLMEGSEEKTQANSEEAMLNSLKRRMKKRNKNHESKRNHRH